MNLKSILVILLAGTSLVFCSGCASKTYVRKQTEPIIDKTNTLDELTAKNTRDIHDVENRAQEGIAGANQKASDADQKATNARSRADQAQTLASQASTRTDALATQVANLDTYHPVVETSVHFGFAKAELTSKAKDALDQLLGEISHTKGYVLVIEGNTDWIGSSAYNYKLSERRAEAVVQYLSEKSIPAHKIFVIGLGKDKSTADNHTAEGRAQNRRVEIRLMSNTTERESTSAQSTAPNPSR